MPHSFDVTVESSVSVEQVFSAFGEKDYWPGRLAIFGIGAARLDSLTTDSDEVSAVVVISLLRDRLPTLITQLHRVDLELVQCEKWGWIDGGRLRGEISVKALGAPLSGVGQALLVPVCDGSRLDYTATVKVGVPLLGGHIEKFIGGQLPDGLNEFVRFTADWIANSVDARSVVAALDEREAWSGDAYRERYRQNDDGPPAGHRESPRRCPYSI